MEQEEWKRNTEALKNTSDWSKWLVTIEAGVITVIGAAVKIPEQHFPIVPKLSVAIAVLLFVVSTISASSTILWISGLMQHSSFGGDMRIMGMPSDRRKVERMLSACIFVQYWTFCVGIGFFGITVIYLAFV